ncbi:MAG: PAS domain-containing sensor histidine kinase [Bacteroidales bacterium]|nr:PAS domain-containing sensor histidine kinase [Bacteroidales bacterium]
METKFLSAERASIESVQTDFVKISNFGHVNDIVNALPHVVLVLNKERQLVYGNHALMKMSGVNEMGDILCKRPGEILLCVHANETEGGCGTTESCRYCGAANTIKTCIETKSKSSGECRITSFSDGKDVSYDFEITASPFKHGDDDYVIVSLQDISNEKRRKVLERVFFHDIINTAGGLNGFLEFLQTTDDPDETKEFIKIAGNLGDKLVDEILAQRQLMEAENGELITNLKPTNTSIILKEVYHQLHHHPVSSGKTIIITDDTIDYNFITDQILLKRILVNLLKNALEASAKGQVVTVGCKKEGQDGIAFWVNNVNEMPRQVQMQIFQRSFSTKGASRGIGTYSIKLFTEFYLKGKVDFTSNTKTGTTFTVHFSA